MMRVLAAALAALVLAAAAPVQAGPLPDPVAVAKAIASDTVQVVISIDGPPTGTLLPLCEPTTDPEPSGTSLVGTIIGDCFQPKELPICGVLVVSGNPFTIPPTIAANPDWGCIDSISQKVQELLNGARVIKLPVQIKT